MSLKSKYQIYFYSKSNIYYINNRLSTDPSFTHVLYTGDIESCITEYNQKYKDLKYSCPVKVGDLHIVYNNKSVESIYKIEDIFTLAPYSCNLRSPNKIYTWEESYMYTVNATSKLVFTNHRFPLIKKNISQRVIELQILDKNWVKTQIKNLSDFETQYSDFFK